jgi:serine/threonine protein kinase
LLPENGFMPELLSLSSCNQLIADRYQIIEVLKQDGYLQSLWAEDIQDEHHRKCLIKQLIKKESIIADPLHKPKSLRSVKRQLSREAEILYQLSNYPQVPQIFAGFKEQQDYYLIQEFIEGNPLSEELPIGKRCGKGWTESQCVAMLQEVLDILESVHQHRAIHCNLNPDNLIRRATDDRLVLINFGAVQPIRPRTYNRKIPITLPIGTFGYLPPEQLTSYPHPNSDLYSLGLIAIQGLTGVHPGQLEVEPTTGEIDWQKELLMPVSEELVTILNRMVQNQYQKRYESASEVAEAIAKLLSTDSQILTLDTSELSGSGQETVDLVTPEQPSQDEIWDRVTPENCTEIENSPTPFEEKTQIEQLEETEVLDINSLVDPSSEASQGSPIAEINSENRNENRADLPAQKTVASRKYRSPSFLVIFMITSLIINSLIGCFGLFQLFQIVPSDLGLERFNQAQELYQAGELSEAIVLAKSVRWDSSVYQEAQTAVEHWQIESEKAAAQFQAIETAFQESRWVDVLSLAGEMPPISYWQDQIAPLVNEAAAKAAPEAQEFLQQAYEQAIQRDFLGAIEQLQQIPYGTPAYQTAQAKIAEYEEKQGIKLETQAYQLLKQAYQRAEVRDFAGAIQLLEQIPEGTPTHAGIQEKISEYQSKRQIKGNALLQQAYDRAEVNDYQGAIKFLKQIPSETPAYQIAQGKIVEYRVKSRSRLTSKTRKQASIAPRYHTGDLMEMSQAYSFNPGDSWQEVNI